MIKSIQKNSTLYKNNNNIWLLYEYLWNNAFSSAELFELSDFLQQNQLFSEFYVLNYKWVKKYYISFFLWEPWYANNFNNFNSWTFYQRYDLMMNFKPMIERLQIFQWNRLKEVELKLYNLEKTEDVKNRDKILKTLSYNKEKTRNYLVKENFWYYLKKLLDDKDYKRFIFNKEFVKNLNFDFYPVEQEIFDVSLQFLTWSKFFIFPFYLKWRNTRVWDNLYQELDFNGVMSRFLDKHIITEHDTKDKDVLWYLYKVSLRPTQVSADRNSNRVTFEWFSSMFDLNSINDSRNMFFEFQHSIFLYTKRPDIQNLISHFWTEFWTIAELSTSDVPKDFNPQYLSHNKFNSAYHVWHLKNMHNILSWLKEYYPVQKNWMLLWKEYFSNNDFQVNIFDLVWKDPTDDSLTWTWNTCILWTTWAWKTHFVKNKIFMKNTTDQLIVFDNMDNFAETYNKMKDGEEKNKINLLEYWPNFPNLLWKITSNNLSLKQEILLKIIIWPNSEITAENKTMINAQINNYLKTVVGNVFNLDRFKEYIKLLKTDFVTQDQKILLINKLDAINDTISQILNNNTSFDVEMYKKQKVILSYWELLRWADKDMWYFLLELLLILVEGYLAEKNRIPKDKVNFRYTMILYDEAHNVIWKTKTLDLIFEKFIREIRNKKSQITLISQYYIDFSPLIHSMIKFYVLLDPQNYELFRKNNSSKSDNPDADDASKLDRTFYNFWPALENISAKYEEDKKLVEEEKIKETDRTRFCVFANLHSNALFILNTR